MGIIDSTRNLLGRVDLRSKTSKLYLNKDGTPKTYVESSSTSSFGGITSSKRTKKTLETYWNYYKGEGTVFAAINTIAWNTVMVGYTLISDDDDAKLLVQKKLDGMDMSGIFLDNMIYSLVYGDAFIEKVFKKNNDDGTLDNELDAYIDPLLTRLSKRKKENSKDYKYQEIRRKYLNRLKQLKFLQDRGDEPKGYLSYIKTIDPVTMEVKTDEYGNETEYIQDIKLKGGKKPIPLTPDEVIHLGFFTQSNSPYHISLIEPSKDTIDRMLDVDNALHQATIRHGTPKFHAQVGTEDSPIPPKQVFDKIKNDLESLSANNEFVTPKIIDIKTIDESGVPNVDAYANLFQKKTIVGLMCPEESLGMSTGGSTEATASVREIMFERYIQSLQHKLATKIRTELINQILVENGFDENIVHMKFKSVTTKDEEGYAKWLGNLLRSGIVPFSINEMRAMFSYPPVEGGEWGVGDRERTPPESSSDE